MRDGELNAIKYQSLCDLRKECGLGCKTCVLNGCFECPESGGVGIRFQPSYAVDNRKQGENGYKLHLDHYSLG